MIQENCQKMIYPRHRGEFRHHQCSRKIWKGDYCKQHHPETVEKRYAAQMERYNEKIANDPVQKLLKKVVDKDAEIKRLRDALECAKNEHLPYRTRDIIEEALKETP